MTDLINGVEMWICVRSSVSQDNVDGATGEEMKHRYKKGTDIYTPHTHGSIDLLLDLDVGTLSYCSNQTFRGILKSGLEVEYVWFISISSMNLVTKTFSMRYSVF